MQQFSAIPWRKVSYVGVILKESLAFKTQYLLQYIYFHHQSNPLKSSGGEQNLTRGMKNNNIIESLACDLQRITYKMQTI